MPRRSFAQRAKNLLKYLVMKWFRAGFEGPGFSHLVAIGRRFRHISWQTAGEFGFVGRLDGKRGVANKEAGAPTKCRPLSSLSPANRPHVFGTFVANRETTTKCACVCHSMRLGTWVHPCNWLPLPPFAPH